MNNEIKEQLGNKGIQLSDLMSALGISTKEEFMTWAEKMLGYDESGNYVQEYFQAVCPYMGDMVGHYADQPVVWDGGFEVIDGTLYYKGMTGSSGKGEPVKRIVFDASIIIAI